MNTKPIGPFLGLNNRLQPFDLRVDTRQIQGDYLAGADNVDIDNSKRISRRNGYSLIQAMTAPHSYFKNLLVRASTLYSVTLSPYTETLLKILTSNDPVSYVEHLGSVYYSNGTDSGRIQEGLWFPWALPTPENPSVATISGTLHKGGYQVAVSYYNNVTGEEGGISASTNYTLAATGAMRVTLPAATTGATHVNVYVTKLSGEVPALYTTVATGTATVDITHLNTTRSGDPEYLEPLPAGTSLFIHMGRLCAAKGDMLYYCEPYKLGYYLPAKGYIQLPTTVSVAVPNQMGVYIAADKTYWVPGDLATPDAPIADVLPYGAVPGTQFVLPHNSKVGWMGVKGFVIADTQGQAEAVMTETVTVTLPVSGCSYLSEENGYRRVTSCGYTLNVENNAVTTYSNYDFTSMSGGYGTKIDGLYQLVGSSDSGSEILSTVNLGKRDFGDDHLKHMPAVYANFSSLTDLELNVEYKNDQGNLVDYTYSTRSSSENLSTQRFDTGKGIRSGWFTLTVYNTSGSDFTLAGISFAPVVSGRRI